MTEVVLAGVLGAAVLAIVLLHKNSQKQADRLAKVEAELVAEKIARLTQQPVAPAPPVEDEPPEPARRKRHLALYIGGGVAAIVTSLGNRFRSLTRQRRAATVTVAASSVLVATSAFAYYANAGSDARPDSTAPVPSATAPDFGDSDAQAPERSKSDDDADDKSGTTTPWGTTGASDAPVPLLDETDTADGQRRVGDHPGGGDPGARADQKHDGDSTPGEPTTPTPTPAGTEPPAQNPAPEPPSTAEPEPSQPPATEPPANGDPDDGDDQGDDGLCIGVPPILELCLPGAK